MGVRGDLEWVRSLMGLNRNALYVPHISLAKQPLVGHELEMAG